MSSENTQPRQESFALPLLAGLVIGAGVFLVGTRPASQAVPAIVSDKPQPADVRPFRNCQEARAAGAAPVYRGDSRYGPWLDRDNDGIGCEPYFGP